MMGYLKRISRDNARTPMQWDDSANAGFTTGTPWIKVNSNYPKVNAKQEISDPDSVFSYYKKLIRLRHENEIIVYGDYKLLAPEDEALFIYTRMLGTQRLMVLCNLRKRSCHSGRSNGTDSCRCQAFDRKLFQTERRNAAGI